MMSSFSMRSGARARQQIVPRIIGMANADMAEAVDDTLAGKDSVGGDELFEQVV
jgi:hypothetical protein